MRTHFKIGTRGSPLALYQAELVKTKIEGILPLAEVSIVKIKTSGDMVRRRSPDPFGTKAIYVREIEEALLREEIDFAVHSAKDLSVHLPPGLKLGAILAREDARDCFIGADGKKLGELGLGARIGTSSLRRKMQLLRRHTELAVEELHGNVESRIKRLLEGEFDGLVLALAGLKRLGLTDHVTEVFPETEFYPAAGQGVIAAEIRQSDAQALEILHPLNDPLSAARLECERAFLKRLGGGCDLPCGIWTHTDGRTMAAGGGLFAVESIDWVEVKTSGAIEDAALIGKNLAEEILTGGGAGIIEKIQKAKSGRPS